MPVYCVLAPHFLGDVKFVDVRASQDFVEGDMGRKDSGGGRTIGERKDNCGGEGQLGRGEGGCKGILQIE